jgi:MFS family permease
MNFLKQLFRPPFPVPAQHRANFKYLYLDMFWYGLLNGSTLVFLAVYATRSGASPQQMGLLSAAPALMNLLITLPAGIWVQRFETRKITCWSSAFVRFFYLLFVPLPLLFPPGQQVWAIIVIVLLMNIPGTVVAVVGNAFLAESVPPEWRGHVVGTRNALLAATTMLTSLICGQILERQPFPTGYQFVFAIGFIGAVASVVQIFLIRPLETPDQPVPSQPSVSSGIRTLLRFEILSGPFGRVLVLLFLYNLSVFISQPVFPLYQVRVLNFSDQTISLGTGVFYVLHFFGSTRTGAFAHRMGNQKMTATGIALTALSTSLFMVSYHPLIYVVSNILAGIGWSMIGGGVLNFLLERVPANDRPPHLAWYNLVVNAAILAGAMLGSQLAISTGLTGAMMVVIAARLVAALSIYRWGNLSNHPQRILPPASRF